VHALDVGFLDEELFDAGAEISQFVLFERLAAADLGEPGVEVERGHRAWIDSGDRGVANARARACARAGGNLARLAKFGV
jgi:hypothetical protein